MRKPDVVNVLCTDGDPICPLFIADLKALTQDHVHVFSSTISTAVPDPEQLRYYDIGLLQVDAARLLPNLAGHSARFLARLYDKEVHVVASREITDVRQLHGRKVNIDKPGTGTHVTARQIFEKLGIAPVFTTEDQLSSYEKLRSGEIAAAIYVAARPTLGIAGFKTDGRFHLVSIPYGAELADYFPTQFEKRDYPNLIQGDTPVQTVSVGTVLAVSNWPEASTRYKRLVRFVDAYFSRFDELRSLSGHPKWDEAIPLGTAPGWERFKPAEEWLRRRRGVVMERTCVRDAQGSWQLYSRRSPQPMQITTPSPTLPLVRPP